MGGVEESGKSPNSGAVHMLVSSAAERFVFRPGSLNAYEEVNYVDRLEE